MAFLSLKSDFIFKTLFSQQPDLLVDLVNAVLDLPEGLSITVFLTSSLVTIMIFSLQKI